MSKTRQNKNNTKSTAGDDEEDAHDQDAGEGVRHEGGAGRPTTTVLGVFVHVLVPSPKGHGQAHDVPGDTTKRDRAVNPRKFYLLIDLSAAGGW